MLIHLSCKDTSNGKEVHRIMDCPWPSLPQVGSTIFLSREWCGEEVAEVQYLIDPYYSCSVTIVVYTVEEVIDDLLKSKNGWLTTEALIALYSRG